MKCPFCRKGDFGVIDSRSHRNGFPMRRRRRCSQCHKKAWTVEVIDEIPLQVVKKSGAREPFDASKIRRGLDLACSKRPVREEQIEALIREVENAAHAEGLGEVASSAVGAHVMKLLRELDAIAYVRFASVCRGFSTVGEFVEEVQPMLPKKRRRNGGQAKDLLEPAEINS